MKIEGVITENEPGVRVIENCVGFRLYEL